MYTLKFFSLDGGLVKNNHGVLVWTDKLEDVSSEVYIFLIPGGSGSRTQVNNEPFLEKIKQISIQSHFVLTVCTGSTLLAKTGLLVGINATSNKGAFSWVITNGHKDKWNKKARWVVDGKYYTSSGVSAGTDMALGFIADRHGLVVATNIARGIEYLWTEDKNDDTFEYR